MQYIYARTSTEGQDTGNQVSMLKERYPNAGVVEEVASGAKSRPMLAALVSTLNRGDTLIVSALDRLGRRVCEILGMIEDLEKRGVILISVRENVDYSTPTGRLVTQVMLSVAELERNLISERTKQALAARRKAGVKLGAKAKYSAEVVATVKQLRSQGATVRAIASQVGMSASRVSQLCRQVA